jgi:hypothetical protein
MQSFASIFARLDSDGDGQISAYRIDISSLEPALLQVLSPLFVEMEELGMSLDQDEFIDAACRLHDSVPLPEKGILVSRRQRSRSNSQRASTGPTYAASDRGSAEQSFRPSLNRNSLRMAERRNQSKGSSNVAERLHHAQKEYDSKMLERRS